MDEKKRGKILIVEDCALFAAVLSDALKDNYDLHIFENGETALKKVREVEPDIILLDVVMAGKVDGFTVKEVLNSSRSTRDIPVIFITGRNNEREEIKGLGLGAGDYIHKPYNPTIVRLRVDTQMKMLEYIRTIEGASITDQLTGLYNRRYYDDRIAKELKRAARDGSPLGMLAVDIDHFKSYNDRYGHTQGDVALQAVAKILKDTLKRASDDAFRWGGEEFVCVMPSTNAMGATQIAEMIRASIEREVIPTAAGEETRVTVSIGIHTEIPAAGRRAGDFFKCADKALYAAKENGRNRIEVYGQVQERQIDKAAAREGLVALNQFRRVR